MIIPTEEHSDIRIKRYISRKQQPVLNILGDSLILFSHTYHKTVDRSIKLYSANGEVVRLANEEEIDKNNNYKRSLKEAVKEQKERKDRKKDAMNNLQKLINPLNKVSLQKYCLNKETDIPELKKILMEDKGFKEEYAGIMADLIADYENLRMVSLDVDLNLAKDFLNNEDNPNYEIESIKNEKSRELMNYHKTSLIPYINSIERLFIKDELSEEDVDLIKKSNEVVRKMIKNSIPYVKDGIKPTDDIIEESKNITNELSEKSEIKKDIFKELIDGQKQVEYNYKSLLNSIHKEKVVNDIKDINNATEYLELNNKRKRTIK